MALTVIIDYPDFETGTRSPLTDWYDRTNKVLQEAFPGGDVTLNLIAAGPSETIGDMVTTTKVEWIL